MFGVTFQGNFLLSHKDTLRHGLVNIQVERTHYQPDGTLVVLLAQWKISNGVLVGIVQEALLSCRASGK
jgi:hypothetical protein